MWQAGALAVQHEVVEHDGRLARLIGHVGVVDHGRR
jgi:hypothetical protein